MPDGKLNRRAYAWLGRWSRALQAVRQFRQPQPLAFLRHISGLIHVGANTGQERAIYARHNLDVVWVEPIDEVFAQLQANLLGFPRQQAYQALLTDVDRRPVEFHISCNGGESSSILALHLHRDIWPSVEYTRTVLLESLTLETLVECKQLALNRYDALVLDTQGSELLVLRGAERLLSHFRFIKVEVPDFEAYAGCCQLAEVQRFLQWHGFREWSRHKFADHPEGGAYYDIVYRQATGGRF